MWYIILTYKHGGQATYLHPKANPEDGSFECKEIAEEECAALKLPSISTASISETPAKFPTPFRSINPFKPSKYMMLVEISPGIWRQEDSPYDDFAFANMDAQRIMKNGGLAFPAILLT